MRIKIPPSEVVRQEVFRLMDEGLEGEGIPWMPL